MYYRKKPVTIEAIVWNGDNIEEISSWTNGDAFWDCDEGTLKIKTLEGIMNASVNDYIIRGVNGEFYACKPDIFQKTYEATANITFSAALDMLMAGFRMRRKCWKPCFRVVALIKPDNTVWLGPDRYLCYETGQGRDYLYIPSNDDLMSDDWEVYTKE